MNHPSSNSRLRRLSRAGLLSVTVLFAIPPASIARAAEEPEYKPPGDLYVMEAHLEWCGEGKTVAARIKRYEEFWSIQSPKESDGYSDGRHIRLVRRCAYRLAELYAQAGRKKDCIKMLKWLEENDREFEGLR